MVSTSPATTGAPPVTGTDLPAGVSRKVRPRRATTRPTTLEVRLKRFFPLSFAASLVQSLCSHSLASNSVPRMPMVATLVRTRKALLRRLLINPVSARRPPRNKLMSTFSFLGLTLNSLTRSTLLGRTVSLVSSAMVTTAKLLAAVEMTSPL